MTLRFDFATRGSKKVYGRSNPAEALLIRPKTRPFSPRKGGGSCPFLILPSYLSPPLNEGTHDLRIFRSSFLFLHPIDRPVLFLASTGGASFSVDESHGLDPCDLIFVSSVVRPYLDPLLHPASAHCERVLWSFFSRQVPIFEKAGFAGKGRFFFSPVLPSSAVGGADFLFLRLGAGS